MASRRLIAGLKTHDHRPALKGVFGGLLLLGMWTALSCTESQKPADRLDVVLAGQTFTLELALDEPARFQGLSDRAAIAPDGGMLFVFSDDQIGVKQFVMRRCPVPLDIVFLDPGGRIVATHAMQVQPPDTPESELKRYSSGYPAQYAIELAGGTLDRLTLHPGQKVDLPHNRLKQAAR